MRVSAHAPVLINPFTFQTLARASTTETAATPTQGGDNQGKLTANPLQCDESFLESCEWL